MGDIGKSVEASTDLALGSAELYFQEQQAKRARERERELRDKMEAIEGRRMEVINPYDEVTDLSDMITDLSGMRSNPYANLGVATQAAEIQMEQTDIALANTLDFLASTGASAGGATALAQAALQGKQGIAASIEAQEVKNEQMRAAGQEALEVARQSEAQRVQAGLFGEAQRQQTADVLGKEFVYGETERRDANDLNRYASLITGAGMAVQDAEKSVGQSIGKLGDTLSQVDWSKTFSKKDKGTKARFSDGTEATDDAFQKRLDAQRKGSE